MNVLVVNPSLFGPAYDYHLCSALSEIGVSVTMVGRPLRQYERPTTGNYEFADLFYRWTDSREGGLGTSRLTRIAKGMEHAAGLKRLAALANEKRADIVHFQWLVVPLLDRIALKRLRRRCGLVLTVHNAELTTHNPRPLIGKFSGIFDSFGRKSAVLDFDRYVVHSTRTLDRLVRLGIAPQRIIRLEHPPLDLSNEEPPVSERIGDTRQSILFFGAIKPYKGVDILVEAGIAMAATRRDFCITIAGQPFQALDTLRARIASAGAEDVFHFDLNYVPDSRLAAYLEAATVVVFPYRQIDGSGALSHAIRFGKPIVASKVGGFAESPFRNYLELVPPEDAGALAATLVGILDSPARLQELSRRTCELQQLLPTWSDYALACRHAYSEILVRREALQ